MSKATRIQTRGHCQCCGAIQAANAFVAKHGYRVQHGYFEGVCRGHNYQPIEVNREQADIIIRNVLDDVADIGRRIELLEAGKSHPATVSTGCQKRVGDKWVSETLKWEDATEYQQAHEVQSVIFYLQSRARAGKQFTDQHGDLCNRVHGQPLIQVKVEAPAARIEAGEQRQGKNTLLLTAEYQDGGMVHYSYTRSNGATFATKMASRSWRALPLVSTTTNQETS